MERNTDLPSRLRRLRSRIRGPASRAFWICTCYYSTRGLRRASPAPWPAGRRPARAPAGDVRGGRSWAPPPGRVSIVPVARRNRTGRARRIKRRAELKIWICDDVSGDIVRRGVEECKIWRSVGVQANTVSTNVPDYIDGWLADEFCLLTSFVWRFGASALAWFDHPTSSARQPVAHHG